MGLKHFIRKNFNSVCFFSKWFLKKRKEWYLNLMGNWWVHRIPFFDKFQYTKKSDTFFIFGSGATVNELGPDQWAYIKTRDSLGFNNWIVHDFVPDIYMFENAELMNTTDVDVTAMKNIFHNIHTKKEAYKDIKFIYKMNTRFSHNPLCLLKYFPYEIKKNLYFSPVIFLSYDDKKSMQTSLEFAFDYLEKNKNFAHIHTAASVFDAISFGVKLRFKKIVLVGIDLTTDYFFEADEYKNYEKEKNVIIPKIPKGEGAYSHPTLHPTESVFKIPISAVLDELDKTILQPRGMQLYVASKNSKLYPRFPCYFN